MDKRKFEDKGTKDTPSMKVSDDPVKGTESEDNKVSIGVSIGRKPETKNMQVGNMAYTQPD